MNYEERMKLQAKLKSFSDAEINELVECVATKEKAEREEKKVQQRMKELYD